MGLKKVIRKRVETNEDGVAISAAVNAVIAGSVGESSSATSVSSRQRIVQKNGVTIVNETETEEGEEG